MVEHLVELDKHLFNLVNQGLTNPVFNWLLPIVRNAKVWIPLYIFIAAFCIYRFKKVGVYIIVLLALTVGLADRGSAGVIKPLVKRLRPCNDSTMVCTLILRVPRSSGYSFPSSHASNHFAVACFLSLVLFTRYRWIWWVAIPWAFLISFAQVYVGVHYPFDVTFGALFGMAVGYGVYLIFKKLHPQF